MGNKIIGDEKSHQLYGSTKSPMKKPGFERRMTMNTKKLNLVNELDNLKLFRKNNKHMESTISLEHALKNHYILGDLDEKIREEIVKELPLYQVESKTTIIKEGTFGEYFYIIDEGNLDVYHNNTLLKSLNDGDTFGEIGLIYDCERSATVITAKKCYIFVMDGKLFQKLLELMNKRNTSEYMNFLNNHKHTALLDIDQKMALSNYYIKMTFKSGQMILREGDVSNSIFIIKEGEVEIKSKEKTVRVIKKGDFFGEISWLLNTFRTKSVYSKGKCILYTISKFNYQNHICAGKLKEQIIDYHIKSSIANSEIFRKFNIKLMSNAIGVFTTKYFTKGEVILKDDYDLSSKIIFVITGAMVNSRTKEVYCDRGQILAENFISKQQTEILGVNLVADPDCLLCEAKVNDFIKATGYSFTDLLNKSELLTQLKMIPLFRSLAVSKLESIVSKIRIEHFNNGETIITQGEEGNKLYIIKRGKVNIFINGNIIRTLNESEYFGDRALFFKEPRSATVKACTDLVELLSLENDDFKLLLETNLKEYLINRLVLQDNKVELKDLEVIKELHRGEFSIIYLCKNKKTKYLYALKRFPAEAIIADKLAAQIYNEKSLLLQIDHPFIVRIVKPLKDEKNVYFLNELVKGEKLSSALYEMGLLNKLQTQFFMSSILILIDSLHHKNVIHRDIRPENIIIGENGYIKILDFSTAKEVKERCQTLIGNPYYMSPEVILGEGYTYSCDFWSCGICAYEFHCGTVPFGDNAEDPMQVYLAIINQDLRFPKFIKDKEFMSCMKLMLFKSPIKRLLKLQQIKQHAYFTNYSFDSIMDLTCEPVYKVKSQTYNIKDTIPLNQYMQAYPYESKIHKMKYEDEEYKRYIYEEWLPKFLIN